MNFLIHLVGYFLQSKPNRNIEELARFPTEDTSLRRQFAYAVKQLVAREIEMEKLRRSEPEGIIIENETNANQFANKSSNKPIPKLESKVVTVKKVCSRT